MTDEKENPTPEHDEAEVAAAEAETHDEVAVQAEDVEPSLEDFKPTMPGNINPEVLQNIVVNLSIEVGRAQIKIKDLMRLTQGSVVELDRIAGEPLDLLVNNSVVAQGEIVLVNDRYGVRLTRVVPSSERLKLI
ncbi:flagellar motor switch protein FliN [Limnohabitans sp. INBF002]|uniref:flagellar motor switch protein FliN n=1 Tax=Limnohabitans sp. INBF002 TaxID=2986280 RepID=UPI0023771B0D|nr:flagellar motor switch protein FliN [Limnohabitans sp. INBF002]BDU52191.1 flagellar motor switch protein FliN [Limnohabitans sp. INBF002]